MATFDRITIIFNPNSTGDSPAMARELSTQLAERLPSVAVRVRETQHAGHAEELARAAARAVRRPLIISVSGDGGYHEVVNGVMAAGNPHAVCAVHGAGNANDHRSATREQPLIEAIVDGKTSNFDILKLETADGLLRYAHSYIGLGISPAVALELNRHELHGFKEIVLAYKTFRAFKPFKIKVGNRRIRCDSLVCANISRMAKVLKLSDETTPDDGRFELILSPHRSKARLVITALRLITLGAGHPPRLSTYTFETLEAMPIQLDGEVLELAASSTLTVTALKRVLNTLA
jgi:diacylglycerol kinase (ATP)